jgi:hypothetical protein
MARELSEVHVTARQGGSNNTIVVIATHLPTGVVAEAMAHTRRQAKKAAYERLSADAAVQAWMTGDG